MREANRSVRHGEKLIMTNSFRSSHITSQSRCTETSHLMEKKKRKGEEWSGEWNREEKRREEKRREEKRREEKRREEKRREEKRREVGNVVKSSTLYCEGESNLRLLRFQRSIQVAVKSKTQECGCLILGSRVRIPPNA